MVKKIRNPVNKKYIHKIIITIIITIIFFILGVTILKYQVEGETNMPFQLSKISIISTSEGQDKQKENVRWAFDLYQSNDIYLSIEKNKNYNKTEAIQSIKINNIKIEANKKENIKIYKPEEQAENAIFRNQEKNIVENIEYTGDIESNIKQMKISNQGGIIAFRCSNNNIAEYTSNEEEINHQELLKKAEIKPEQLKTKITFDLSIQLQNQKEYQSTITLDLPVEDVIEKGIASTEITDLKNFIFKRTNN